MAWKDTVELQGQEEEDRKRKLVNEQRETVEMARICAKQTKMQRSRVDPVTQWSHIRY